jgi:hypothetical protein
VAVICTTAARTFVVVVVVEAIVLAAAKQELANERTSIAQQPQPQNLSLHAN